MWKSAIRIIVTVGLSGLLLSVNGDDKADKKKAQAAWQRGQRADKSGKRDDAIAAYTEALTADPFNTPTLRARAKDYLDAQEREKAMTDIAEAIRIQPGDPQNYAARAD